MPMMRAGVIRGFGPPEVLRVESVEQPRAGHGDVLVRVHAASVNPIDCKVRSGTNRAILPPQLPWILGLDLSGVVEEVGPGVTGFRVGDTVFGSPSHRRPGTYAELVAVDARELAPKPASLSHVEAASLPLVFQTAWDCLVRAAALGPGQTVLVHAGSGGVGTMAIQLARHLQAHIVTTCSPRNAELVRSLGADHVIDYREQDFTQELSGLDVILDGLGRQTQLAGLPVLAPGGRLVSIASGLPAQARTWGPWLGLLVTALDMAWRSARARLSGRRLHHVIRRADAGVLLALERLIAVGSIRPVVDRVFPLEALAEAHAYSETGRARGKIVIAIA